MIGFSDGASDVLWKSAVCPKFRFLTGKTGIEHRGFVPAVSAAACTSIILAISRFLNYQYCATGIG